MIAAQDRWYRQPVMWLGTAIFFASLAGCIGMVVLASRFPDEPLPLQSDQLLKMPASRALEDRDDGR